MLYLNHHISAKKLDEFYNVINDMTLIVKKYDGVISSTLHEREYKLFGALKESSRIESIIKNIEYKSNLLERKLRWELSRKSLRSDRNTELLLIFLTAFQCFFIISENLKTLINPILLLLFLLLLFVILIIYRKKY